MSCTVCHQITEQGLGTRESFVGGFSVDTTVRSGDRPIYGPFQIDAGHTRIMQSAVGFKQTTSTLIQKSEVCATCHTLLTKALNPEGEAEGELPEQVPYQEWLHSSYREEKSCQDRHMPVVTEPSPIASVLGEPREGMKRHDFRGGNFFMLQMLGRHRSELGVPALPQELDLAARKTRDTLQNDTARVTIENAEVRNGRVEALVAITSLVGHKLPSAYPSRRVWLRVSVRVANGRVVFESGGLDPNGSIRGNDNDADPARFEAHYEEIRSADQVQIYESVMLDRNGAVTTGLLTALRYGKDNRPLPTDFDKRTAGPDIAAHGAALNDADFTGGSDRVPYSVDATGGQGPFTVEGELCDQPIGYRWAENLRHHDTAETNRFVGYYESMASSSGILLVRASATAR